MPGKRGKRVGVSKKNAWKELDDVYEMFISL